MMAWSTTIRRAGVTAFSVATLTKTAATTSRGSSSLAARRGRPFWGARYAACGSLGFLLGQSRKDDGCLTSLRQSSTATANELEKTLGVTHPAYEVIYTDVVTEYGAYCTLFKHKKSGAELLSVSNDDDNKVSRRIFAILLFQKSSFRL
jgi:hypothetical protein